MLSVLVGILFLLSSCGGPKGDPGPVGASGSTGPAGSGLTVYSNNTCVKADNGSGTSLTYSYQVVVFSSGDSFVTASVINSTTTSNSKFYSKNQGTDNSVDVFNPLPGDSFGYWTFSTQGTTRKVVYTSLFSSHNNYTYTFSSSNCF